MSMVLLEQWSSEGGARNQEHTDAICNPFMSRSIQQDRHPKLWD